MEDQETGRKIIRQWMAFPKDKRQTEKQVAIFAKKAAQENEFQRSRHDPYQKDGYCRALASRDRSGVPSFSDARKLGRRR
jgi:hypothetical protein